jgi:hypothetical protein
MRPLDFEIVVDTCAEPAFARWLPAQADSPSANITSRPTHVNRFTF